MMQEDDRPGPVDAPGGGKRTGSIVVGHDQTEPSRAALAVAADLARHLGVPLHVVHGIDLDDYPVDPDLTDWEEQAAATLDRQRADVAAALGRQVIGGWTYHAGRGDPVAFITAVANAHDAVMIVIGVSGGGISGAVQRLLGGSIFSELLRRQFRPVLVVPHPDTSGDTSR